MGGSSLRVFRKLSSGSYSAGAKKVPKVGRAHWNPARSLKTSAPSVPPPMEDFSSHPISSGSSRHSLSLPRNCSEVRNLLPPLSRIIVFSPVLSLLKDPFFSFSLSLSLSLSPHSPLKEVVNVFRTLNESIAGPVGSSRPLAPGPHLALSITRTCDDSPSQIWVASTSSSSPASPLFSSPHPAPQPQPSSTRRVYNLINFTEPPACPLFPLPKCHSQPRLSFL